MLGHIGLSFLALSTLGIVLFAEKNLLLGLIIVLGQAHFILTYIYQYKKGKISKKYIHFYPIFFITTFFTIASLYKNSTFVNFFTLTAGMIFVFHYFNDEFHLRGVDRSRKYTMGLISVLISFLGTFVSMVFNIHYSKIIPLVVMSLIFFGLFTYIDLKDSKKNIGLFIFILLNTSIPIYLLFTEKGTLVQLWGFIILFHYLRWYIYYYSKFKGNSQEFSPYLIKVFVVNTLAVSLYLLYIYYPTWGTYLNFFFNQQFFYGWTLMHIIFTLRKKDSLLSLHE